jgi:hypothetical protein
MKSLMPLWLFLSGCAAQPHIPEYHYTDKVAYHGKPKEIWVWIDKEFDVFDRIAITEAMASWNKSLNGYIELKPVNKYISQDRPEMPRDQDWIFTKVDPGSASLAKAKAGQVTIGTADFIGGHNVFLARQSMNLGDVYYVSLHEMGHLLGADHRGEKLMYPTYTEDRFHCIDWLTVSQVAVWNNLPISEMNYCTRY